MKSGMIYKMKAIVFFLMALYTSTFSLIEKRVGNGETYSTIMAAIASLPQPVNDDVRIIVSIHPGGWVETALDIDVSSVAGTHTVTIEYIDRSTATYYVGDDLEYRKSDNVYTVVENYTGTSLEASRIYSSSDAAASQNRYFIKNHLGSTITQIEKSGERVAPVYDYFAYGKQIEEVTMPDQVTHTFTGKEFDLFENNVVTGDDGEGLYYFGKRYYDAEIGRWTSVDPMGQYVDAYLYGGNNPANRIDPDGGSDIDMCPECNANITWDLADGDISKYSQLRQQQAAMTSAGILGIGSIAAGAWAYGGGLATTEGFLLGSINLAKGLPFAIPVIRFGSMDGGIRAFTSNFSGIAALSPRFSQFMVRTFGAVKPAWNNLTRLTIGKIPAGTPLRIGIAAPQGGRQLGGLLQMNLKPETVQVMQQMTIK